MSRLLGEAGAADYRNDLAAFGLAEVEDEKGLTLWPENVAVIEMLPRLRGCWRHGALGGLVGLDWPQVMATLRLDRVPRERWAELTDGLRVAEAEVIRCLAAKTARRAKSRQPA